MSKSKTKTTDAAVERKVQELKTADELISLEVAGETLTADEHAYIGSVFGNDDKTIEREKQRIAKVAELQALGGTPDEYATARKAQQDAHKKLDAKRETLIEQINRAQAELNGLEDAHRLANEKINEFDRNRERLRAEKMLPGFIRHKYHRLKKVFSQTDLHRDCLSAEVDVRAMQQIIDRPYDSHNHDSHERVMQRWGGIDLGKEPDRNSKTAWNNFQKKIAEQKKEAEARHYALLEECKPLTAEIERLRDYHLPG